MRRILLPLCLIALFSCAQKEVLSPVDSVNLFIGTDGHGHTFPGATLPGGFVQLSPDTGTDGWDWCSGYHSSDNSIIGFSHSHLSGTGAADLGDILFMPSLRPEFKPGTKEDPDSGYRSRFSHDNETAKPGYYSVELDDAKTFVELTATQHAGIQKYTFRSEAPHYVVLDLAFGIQDEATETSVTMVSDTAIEGYRRSRGWADDHTVFFHAEFSAPFVSMQVNADGVESKATAGLTVNGKEVVSVMEFAKDVNPLVIKVGISYVDIEGAKNNLEVETSGRNFEEVAEEAYDIWKNKLSKVYVSGPQDRREIFYTALYHALVAPYMMSDVDGRYRSSNRNVYKSDEPNYGLFSTWDTFRALHPLMTIVDPETNAEFAKSMIRYYKESGRLPVWDLNMRENFCMIGYHSIPVITDAYFKGAQIDAPLALEAMVHSATEDSYQGLGHYRHYRYMPSDLEPNSVSKALEMSYDDWCIAMMAKALGREDIYNEFIVRAQYYKNHLDPADTFMKGRDSHGRFRKDFSPTQISILGQSDFTEGNSWHYTFFAPQDINTMIELMGGDEKFIAKLEELFNSETENNGASPDVSGMIGNYAQGNEPSHHVAYLYAYAGQQWRSAFRVNQICEEMFTTARDGLCGNEDCGQMSAWYCMSAMGFYEVTPGSCIYVLGSPQMDTVKVGNFELVAANRSDKNIYIGSATWNGQPYTKSYITHDMLVSGGKLVLNMQGTPQPSFGAEETDRPHSVISDNVMSSEQLLKDVSFAPFVDVEERFFEDSLAVTPLSILNGDIHYTMDMSEPTAKSPVCNGPIVLKDDCFLKLAADNGNGIISRVYGVQFCKGRLVGAKIEFPDPAPQYSGKGAETLTDGLSGGTAYSGGGWLGWNGGDITITVTLPSKRHISSVGLDFLASVETWIALPSGFKVEFEDGTTAEVVIPEGTDKEQRTAFFAAKCNVEASSFKIILPKNVIPSWHRSHDKPAWVFVDEIVVK